MQQTFSEVEDLETWISDEEAWQQEHLAAWIFGLFAGLALVLAGVGLYSVVSYSVAQRTNEFGIRVALGAGRGHVLRIVFASTVVSVGSGIAVGIGTGSCAELDGAEVGAGERPRSVGAAGCDWGACFGFGGGLCAAGAVCVPSGSDDGAAI